MSPCGVCLHTFSVDYVMESCCLVFVIKPCSNDSALFYSIFFVKPMLGCVGVKVLVNVFNVFFPCGQTT